MNSIVRMLAVYAGLSLLLCGFTHLEWSPLQPNGFGQWFALFLLIFPAAAAAEFLGEHLLGKRASLEFEEPHRAERAGCRCHHRCRDGRGVVAVASGRGVVLTVSSGVRPDRLVRGVRPTISS